MTQVCQSFCDKYIPHTIQRSFDGKVNITIVDSRHISWPLSPGKNYSKTFQYFVVNESFFMEKYITWIPNDCIFSNFKWGRTSRWSLYYRSSNSERINKMHFEFFFQIQTIYYCNYVKQYGTEDSYLFYIFQMALYFFGKFCVCIHCSGQFIAFFFELWFEIKVLLVAFSFTKKCTNIIILAALHRKKIIF